MNCAVVMDQYEQSYERRKFGRAWGSHGRTQLSPAQPSYALYALILTYVSFYGCVRELSFSSPRPQQAMFYENFLVTERYSRYAMDTVAVANLNVSDTCFKTCSATYFSLLLIVNDVKGHSYYYYEINEK